METTFDKFINNNSEQKALFDKEYADFSRSEHLLGNLTKVHKQSETTSRSVNRRKYALA